MLREHQETLIDRLNNAFLDETTKTNYREKTKAKLAKDATRVFDGFQILVNDTVLQRLCAQFSSIITSTHRVRNTSNGPIICQNEPKEAIRQLQKTIAKIACFELFDQNQRIKPALIQLLDWSEFEGKIDNCELVCAFVNEINLIIFQKLARFINSNEGAFNAHCQLINQQYPFWTSEVLDAMSIPFDHTRVNPVTVPALSSDSDDEPTLTGRDIAIGVGAGIGGGLLFGAAIAGLVLFGISPSSNRDESNPSPNVPPPKSPRH